MTLLGQGPSGGEEPVDGVPQVLGRLAIREIALDVLHGCLQHVELVPQLIQRSSGDHQLGLAEAQLGSALAGDVRGLTARLLAEPSGPPGTAALGQPPTAPPAPARDR